ncbi:MAG TPA: hypothetical protein VF092_24880 [Longimicrobium sp.]
MNAAHLHLLLNHLPVVGTIGCILLLALAAVRRSPELAKVSLGMVVLVALAGAAAYLTGEPAEESVEHAAGVSEALIERHEEAALVALLLLSAVGALSLVELLAFRRRAVPRPLILATLLAALLPAAAMGYTANLGGQIRHAEIRAGAPVAGGEQASEAGERD